MKLLVSPERLLPRDSQPVYGTEAKALINDKTVMVTGAGGSIGSEIVKQCIRLGARRIVKVDISENALFELSLNTLGHALFLPEDDFFLVNVTDRLAINQLIGATQPDIIFHAAAKKHLPLTQAHPNTAINVNVFGTRSVIQAAVEHKVPQVINISTDKAAEPSSILGWSKRLAELVCANYTNPHTRITSVRFGNVLGSNGSLLPAIQHRLENNLPVQITDPEVTRFFMTIPEATGLVIESARMSQGGEVFILDMGEPIKIVDIVNDFVKLSNMENPKIEFVGLRPGEKLHEELFSNHEKHGPTSHPRISMASINSEIDVNKKLSELENLLSMPTSPEKLQNALTLDNKER